MKNVYVKPQILITRCEAEQVLASSVTVDSGTTVQGTSAGWTKEENDWDIWDADKD